MSRRERFTPYEKEIWKRLTKRGDLNDFLNQNNSGEICQKERK